MKTKKIFVCFFVWLLTGSILTGSISVSAAPSKPVITSVLAGRGHISVYWDKKSSDATYAEITLTRYDGTGKVNKQVPFSMGGYTVYDLEAGKYTVKMRAVKNGVKSAYAYYGTTFRVT